MTADTGAPLTRKLYEDARRFIKSHYSEVDLSQRRVATALGVSRWRLSRAFSAADISFRSAIKEARMHSAVERLAAESTPIKIIALEVGYAHCSDFSREFRSRYGTTPSVYRQQYANKSHIENA